MPRRPLIPTPELRRVVGDLLDLQTKVGRLERGGRATQLGHSSIDGGYLTIRDADGLPRGYIGNQPDGTTGVRAVNGPPPSRPDTPDLTPIIDGISVAWNGTFVDPRPLDFLHVRVYVSGASADFIHGPSNLIGVLAEAGSLPVTQLSGPQWARFVAVNTSGKESEPSFTAGPATPLAVVATDVIDGIITDLKLAAGAVTEAKLAASAVTVTKIADDAVTSPKIIAGGIQAVNLAVDSVSAGKIAADAVTAREILALTITAAEIAANAINATHITAGSVTASKLESVLVLTNRVVVGAAAGDRVEINATSGIEQWLSGTRTLHIPPTGTAAFTGRITVGVGIGLGRTIVLDPTNTVAQFYPDTTGNRFELHGWTNPTPIFEIKDMSSAGAYRGAQFLMSLRRIDMSTNIPGPTGARFVMDNANVDLSADNSLAMESNGDVTVTAGDDVVISGGNDTDLFLDVISGQAQLWSGGDLKAFVIEHPTDSSRRLVHVCTETPNAMVEYVGTATLTNGVAEVGTPELPAYFEALTEAAGRTVTATLVLPDKPLKRVMTRPNRPPVRDGKRIVDLKRPRKVELPEHALMPAVAASLPVDGTFRIACGAPDGTQVSWRVTANRKNTKFDVEPLAATTPLPDGPYGVATPKESSNG